MVIRLFVSLQFTYNMEYSATGLRPFTDYEVQVSVANMYTLRRNYVDQLLSNGERFLTSEGGNINVLACELSIA